ncbi:MAG: nucleotidyl transferase AbiEii/AbiGii toxin family protein [Akkermansia sp.]
MNIFDEMLASYETGNDNDKLNAVHEVMQQVALGGLYNGGFFNKAAFYGGTCLRIFYGLDRFSERAYQFGSEESGKLTPDRFRTILKDKIKETDLRQVKNDVMPFIKEQNKLNIWSTEYFLHLADMVKLS